MEILREVLLCPEGGPIFIKKINPDGKSRPACSNKVVHTIWLLHIGVRVVGRSAWVLLECDTFVVDRVGRIVAQVAVFDKNHASLRLLDIVV